MSSLTHCCNHPCRGAVSTVATIRRALLSFVGRDSFKCGFRLGILSPVAKEETTSPQLPAAPVVESEPVVEAATEPQLSVVEISGDIEPDMLQCDECIAAGPKAPPRPPRKSSEDHSNDMLVVRDAARVQVSGFVQASSRAHRYSAACRDVSARHF